MKTTISIILFSFALFGCSNVQHLTYRPVNSEKLFNIRIEQGTVSTQFEVYINDELVMEETPSIFSDSINETTEWNGMEVKLIVNKFSSCLGLSDGYDAMLLINNELVSQLEF